VLAFVSSVIQSRTSTECSLRTSHTKDSRGTGPKFVRFEEPNEQSKGLEDFHEPADFVLGDDTFGECVFPETQRNSGACLSLQKPIFLADDPRDNEAHHVRSDVTCRKP
jgi:hypothetical protein